MKPSIKDTPKEDEPPNKGQAERTLVYTLYRKSPLKEDNLSRKDKTAGPKGVLIKRFNCTVNIKKDTLKRTNFPAEVKPRALHKGQIDFTVLSGYFQGLYIS